MYNRTVIQKQDVRYTFDQVDGRCLITMEHNLVLGASVLYRHVTKEEGNKFYLEKMASGYKRFRNVAEVSWYATTENNTPYEEKWCVRGNYLVPVKSRVLQQ